MTWATPNKGLKRKAASFKRNAMGVTKIKRDGYSTVNGFSKANEWWAISAQVRKRSKGLCEDTIHRGAPVKGHEVHHIVPLSKGGRTTLANLIHLCTGCHDRRHNHLFRSR
jgi:5-methylcytosine-specific restriction endonuclease McrA